MSDTHFGHRHPAQPLSSSRLGPVYIHKDADTAYGVTFPDFPGCFSAADEMADLPRMAQEAVDNGPGIAGPLSF